MNNNLPVEIYVLIAEYLTDKDKVAMCSTHRIMRDVMCYMTFDTWVNLDSVKGLPFFDCFQNVQACVDTIELPAKTQRLRLLDALELPCRHYYRERTAYKLPPLPSGLKMLSIACHVVPYCRVDISHCNLTHVDLEANVLSQAANLLSDTVTHVICRFVNTYCENFVSLRNSNVRDLSLVNKTNTIVKIDCKNLPQTLTHFRSGVRFVFHNEKSLSMYGLVHWICPSPNIRYDLALMPQIEKLYINSSLTSDILTPKLHKLVVSKLILTLTHGIFISTRWMGQSLQTLSVLHTTTLDVMLMPNLKRLLVGYSDDILNLESHSNLETLIVGCDIRKIPPNLRHFKTFHNPPSMSSSQITHLSVMSATKRLVVPNSVTHLYVQFGECPVKNHVVKWSTGLEVLAVGIDLIGILSENNVSLPNGCLHTISLHDNTIHNIGIMLKIGHDFFSKHRKYRSLNYDYDEVSSDNDSLIESVFRPSTRESSILSEFFSKGVNDVYLQPGLSVDTAAYNDSAKIHYLTTEREIIGNNFKLW